MVGVVGCLDGLGVVRSNCHERDRSRLLGPDDQTKIAKNGLSSLFYCCSGG